MTTIYVAAVTGDGQTPETAWRAAGFDGLAHVALMVDAARGRAIVLANSDTVTGAGITALFTAADLNTLRTKARATNVPAAKRTTINNWLAAAQYPPLPAAALTWWDVLTFAVTQGNPGIDLGALYLAVG